MLIVLACFFFSACGRRLKTWTESGVLNKRDCLDRADSVCQPYTALVRLLHAFNPAGSFSHARAFGSGLLGGSCLEDVHLRTRVPAVLSASDSSRHIAFRLACFNILAPCYHRLKRKASDFYFESHDEMHYVERNRKIIDMLEETEADVILLQEWWVTNERLKGMYRERFGDKFELVDIQRSSHWRKRDDGLACFVRKGKFVIQDSRDIVFHDAGDRVAKMLLLAAIPDDPDLPPQQLIVINTHLLFPHNECSSKIRKREMMKILGFVESYRQRDLCSDDVCSRDEVRLPVVVAGDFNGSPNGCVQSLLLEQRYQNSYVKHTGKLDWVSHKTHRQTVLGVDHVMFLNPSDQEMHRLPAAPDWTNLVYGEMLDKIVEKFGDEAVKKAFAAADEDDNSVLDKDEFQKLINSLGFEGEKDPALTREEVELLMTWADENGDGSLDFQEFMRRLGFPEESACVDQEMVDGGSDPCEERYWYVRSDWLGIGGQKGLVNSGCDPRLDEARPCGDLAVENARLYPRELEDGEWPEHWDLSDHGLVLVDFVGEALPLETSS